MLSIKSKSGGFHRATRI